MKLSFFSSRKIAGPFREVLPPRLCCNTGPLTRYWRANFPILKYCGMGVQDRDTGCKILDMGCGLRVLGFVCLEGIGAKSPAQGQDSKNLNRGLFILLSLVLQPEFPAGSALHATGLAATLSQRACRPTVVWTSCVLLWRLATAISCSLVRFGEFSIWKPHRTNQETYPAANGFRFHAPVEELRRIPGVSGGLGCLSDGRVRCLLTIESGC